jgi:hypothetical protein
MLKRTAVRFDLSKSKSIKRDSVLTADLDDHLIVITPFVYRDLKRSNDFSGILMFLNLTTGWIG